MEEQELPSTEKLFPITENQIWKKTGIRRSLLVENRPSLVRGKDWEKVGSTICYTVESAIKVCKSFLPENIPINFEGPDIREVRVVRANFINRRIVEVEPETGFGDKFLVRVKDATNFVPGMIFRCWQLDGDSMHQLIGRSPRYRGKW